MKKRKDCGSVVRWDIVKEEVKEEKIDIDDKEEIWKIVENRVEVIAREVLG